MICHRLLITFISTIYKIKIKAEKDMQRHNQRNSGSPIKAAPKKKDNEYFVSFQIQYETKFGQSLAVIGSIEELGKWKEYKCQLQWTDGHIWINKEPLMVS